MNVGLLKASHERSRAISSDDALRAGVSQPDKTTFKLFDFFANCEYFETEFNYDEVLKLPALKQGRVNCVAVCVQARPFVTGK